MPCFLYGFSEHCKKLNWGIVSYVGLVGSIWNVAFSFVLLTLFMSGWATNRHKYSIDLRAPFCVCLLAESVYLNLFSWEEGTRAQWQSTRINYAKGTQLIYIELTFGLMYFWELHFLKKGFRSYLIPLSLKWIGRALLFWPAHFPLVFLSSSLSGYGLQLRLQLPSSHSFFLCKWAGCPGASRGSSPTLLISHPLEGKTVLPQCSLLPCSSHRARRQ